MPEAKPWLSLRVLPRPEPENRPLKVSLLISIPKKIVRLATQRNRIKRLIREAVRQNAFFDDSRIYQFRVLKRLERPGLKEIQECINILVREYR